MLRGRRERWLSFADHMFPRGGDLFPRRTFWCALRPDDARTVPPSIRRDRVTQTSISKPAGTLGLDLAWALGRGAGGHCCPAASPTSTGEATLRLDRYVIVRVRARRATALPVTRGIKGADRASDPPSCRFSHSTTVTWAAATWCAPVGWARPWVKFSAASGESRGSPP